MEPAGEIAVDVQVGNLVGSLQVGWLGLFLHILVFLLVCYHVLSRRREATSAVLWMFIAWALPIMGPLLFLYLGRNRVREKGFHKHAKDMRLLAERKAREAEALPLAYWRSVHEAVRFQPAGAPSSDLNHMLDAILREHPLLGGNLIEPLVDGDEAFPRMMEAILNARHHVHIQSFIISDDTIGRPLMELLKVKAAQGVKVRLMFDRFGSTRAVMRGLFRRYRSVPGLQIVGWTQANPLKRQFQINLRNHRKIMVIDGAKGFCGGINLHDGHITLGSRQAIRDYHFEVSGPIVQELQYTFMRDWYFMTDEDPEALLQEVYFPHLPSQGHARIRLVNGGPAGEQDNLADMFFAAIVTAQKSITILTPYFVPTGDMLRAIRSAALRGVSVRLVVPRDNNHVYAGLAGRATYEPLLEAGVRILERRPPFMHAKTIVIDDEIAIVGTANLDVRSFKLNYETNLVVCDQAFVNKLKRIIAEDVAMSDELDLVKWRARPAAMRLLENFCALLTPVL